MCQGLLEVFSCVLHFTVSLPLWLWKQQPRGWRSFAQEHLAGRLWQRGLGPVGVPCCWGGGQGLHFKMALTEKLLRPALEAHGLFFFFECWVVQSAL